MKWVGVANIAEGGRGPSVSPEALSSTAYYYFMICLAVWRHAKSIGVWLLEGGQSALLVQSENSQSGS